MSKVLEYQNGKRSEKEEEKNAKVTEFSHAAVLSIRQLRLAQMSERVFSIRHRPSDLNPPGKGEVPLGSPERRGHRIREDVITTFVVAFSLAPLVTNLGRLVPEYRRICGSLFRWVVKVSGQRKLASVDIDHSAIDNILLVRLHVAAKLILAVEVATATAHIAVKATLDLVGTLMLGQVGRFAELLAADGALERLLA